VAAATSSPSGTAIQVAIGSGGAPASVHTGGRQGISSASASQGGAGRLARPAAGTAPAGRFGIIPATIVLNASRRQAVAGALGFSSSDSARLLVAPVAPPVPAGIASARTTRIERHSADPLGPLSPALPPLAAGAGTIAPVSLGGGSGAPGALLLALASLALFAWLLMRRQVVRLPLGIVLSNPVPPG
jgi:hypothetical protein